jgi:hypothetical protein
MDDARTAGAGAQVIVYTNLDVATHTATGQCYRFVLHPPFVEAYDC